jgi:hypothetical protein
VIEAEAALVREVFDRYGSESVASMGALAATLNDEGKRRRARLWTDKGVQDVIRART